MGHGNFPRRYERYGRMNKKKLAIALLLLAAVAIVILILLTVAAVAIIKALLGQADGGVSQSLADIMTALWSYIQDFVQALWRQVISNPLQLLNGN